jgi:type I restriction enzyme S subunit
MESGEWKMNNGTASARHSQLFTHNSPLIPPGYKHTEMGVIPEDWEVKSLGDVFAFSGGLTASRAQLGDSGYCYLHYGDIHTSSKSYVDVDAQHVDLPKLVVCLGDVSRKSILLDGDVVFVDASENDEGTSKHQVVKNPRNIPFISGLHTIVAKSTNDDLVRNYKCHCFQSWSIKKQFLFYSVGTKVTGISKGNIGKILLPIPPVAEQESIAEALSDADALIESLERLIAKKRQIKQGAMQELLTGKKRLPGFSGEWEERAIAEIGAPSSEKNQAAEELPVLTCSKHYGFVESLSYFKNQVFSKDTSGYKVIRRGQIGYPANHIEEGSIGLQDLYDVALVSPIYVVFSVNSEVDSYFLHRLLKLDSYRQKFATATDSSVNRRGSLRWPAFSEITVKLPPPDEQAAVSVLLADIEAEIAALETKLAKACQIKGGMMQELLTGRIRLV